MIKLDRSARARALLVSTRNRALMAVFVSFFSGLVNASESSLEHQTTQFQTGWSAAQNGQLDKAYQIWDDLSKESIFTPELNRALQNNLAVILIKQKNYQAAERLLDLALQADHQVGTTLDNLNQLYAYQAQKTYQKIFSETSIVEPRGVFLFFDVNKARLPTENVVMEPPEFIDIQNTQNTQDTIKVQALLEAWRLAWSRQDVEAYLKHYDKNEFIPKNGMSYATWENSRYRSLQNPKFITVAFKELQVVQLDKNMIRSRFLQQYSSDRLQDTIYKVVLWQLSEGQWQIVQEVVVDVKG